MRVWRPGITLIVAAVLLTSGAANARAAGVVPTPPWLSHNGTSFGITTTGDWRVVGAGGARAKVVEVLNRSVPGANTGEERQGRMLVWAPTCEKGAQTIRISRTVVVPGPPGQVSAVISPVTTGGFRIASAALYVNGQPLLRGGAGGIGSLAPTATKAPLFRFGQNTIELVATKAPSPGGAACNVSKATRVGVLAFVHGDFATDMGLVEAAADRYFDGSNSASVGGQVSFTVRNNGPGGAARGRFWFNFALPYTTEPTIVKPTVPAGGPFRECAVAQQPGSTTYEGTCEFADIRPRSSYVLNFRYGAFAAIRGTADVSVVLRWGVSLEGTDTDPSNNERLAKLWYCVRGVADSGKSCKTG